MRNLILSFSLLFLFSCGNSKKAEVENSIASFDKVGYFKSPNKLRYYTIHLKTSETDVSQVLKDAVLEHGKKLMNTAGQTTVGFYYLQRENTPDITNLSASKANEVAHNHKPLFTVWNYGNGNVMLLENP